MIFYHYDADNREICFCYNDEITFDGELLENDEYAQRLWEIPEELLEEIEDAGYVHSYNHHFSAWRGGFLQGWGDAYPPVDGRKWENRLNRGDLSAKGRLP
jgi:hypothetical protein